MRSIPRLVGARLALLLPLLALVTLVVFALAANSPFDPLLARLGSRAFSMSGSELEALRMAQGEPSVLAQWATWWGDALRGDLGVSLSLRQEVTQVIAERLPWTLLLMAVALVLAVGTGLVLGTLAAVRSGGWLDRVVTGTAYVVQASPVFWVALLGMWLFAIVLGWVPAGGLTDPGSDVVTLGALVRHLALPAVVLGLSQAPWFVLVVRDTVREELAAPYVLGAWGRGVSTPRVVVRHALRSGLLPMVTVLGVRVPELVTGAVLVETIFSWPGIASATVTAATSVDFGLLAALTVVTTVVVVLGNLTADVAYRLLDPRVGAAHE